MVAICEYVVALEDFVCRGMSLVGRRLLVSQTDHHFLHIYYCGYGNM